MAAVKDATHGDIQATVDKHACSVANETTYPADSLEAAAAQKEPAEGEDLTRAEAAHDVASFAQGAIRNPSTAIPATALEDSETDKCLTAGTATAGDSVTSHTSTAAAAAAVVDNKDTSPPVLHLMRQFSQQRAEQEAAPSITISPGRTSSTTAPTAWAAAPAASSDEAESHPLVVHASSSERASQDTPAVNVRELREQLSATRIPLTAQMAAPPKPPSPQPKTQPALPVSQHDKVNTVNVAALLASAEFKKVPGQDVIPYDDLVTLRLEDGVDVTRKEDYLSVDDFMKVFGCSREAYGQMPQWKRLQIKRSVKLF